MSVSISYVLTEHRARALSTVRTIVLLALVMAVVFFLASFWPAKEFAATAAYELARFDVVVNGPFRQSDLEHIDRLLPVGATSLAVYTGNLTSVEVGDRVLDGVPAVLYPRERARDVTATYLSPGLLLRGAMSSTGSAGIDAVTAARLRVGLGDVLRYRQSVDADAAHDLRGSARITAVFAPTVALAGVVLPLDPRLSRALSGGERIAGSDLFIRTGGGSASSLTSDLAGLQGAENWNVNLVADQLARARRDVEQAASRAVRLGMILGALVIYALYVARDQLGRVQRRRKDVAIMISLGEPVGRITAVFVIEQLILAAIATALGLWAADYVIRALLHLYVPAEARFLLAALAIGVNAAVSLAIALQIRRRAARLPVARILAAE